MRPARRDEHAAASSLTYNYVQPTAAAAASIAATTLANMMRTFAKRLDAVALARLSIILETDIGHTTMASTAQHHHFTCLCVRDRLVDDRRFFLNVCVVGVVVSVEVWCADAR